MAAPIDFYSSWPRPTVISASTQIEALAARHRRTVAWRPIMLGAAFKETGARPLMHTPLKGPTSSTTCRALPACSACRSGCRR